MALADPDDFEPIGAKATAVADPNDFEPIAARAKPSDFEPITATPEQAKAALDAVRATNLALTTSPGGIIAQGELGMEQMRQQAREGAQFATTMQDVFAAPFDPEISGANDKMRARQPKPVPPGEPLTLPGGTTIGAPPQVDISDVPQVDKDFALEMAGKTAQVLAYPPTAGMGSFLPEMSEETAQRIADAAARTERPDFTGSTGKAAAQDVLGAYDAIRGQATPENVALLVGLGAIGSIVKFASLAAAIGFTGKATHDLYQGFQSLDKITDPNERERTKASLVANAVIASAGALAGGKEIVERIKTANDPLVTPEQRAAAEKELHEMNARSISATVRQLYDEARAARQVRELTQTGSPALAKELVKQTQKQTANETSSSPEKSQVNQPGSGQPQLSDRLSAEPVNAGDNQQVTAAQPAPGDKSGSGAAAVTDVEPLSPPVAESGAPPNQAQTPETKPGGGTLPGESVAGGAQEPVTPDNAAHLEVRAPSDNVTDVLRGHSNYPAGATIETIPIDAINSGGVTDQPTEKSRVNKLVEQMKGEDGHISRLIVDHDNNVVEGQHRLEALRELGVRNVPVVKIHGAEDFISNVNGVASALRDAGLTRHDQINQMISHVGEILMDEKGDVGELDSYDAPNGHQKAWDAAIKEIKRQSNERTTGAAAIGIEPQPAGNVEPARGGSGAAPDWTSATEDTPATTETQKGAIKMKLGQRNENGFVDTSIVGDLADYAHDFFKKGMERAKWITHAIAEFGKGIRDLAGKAWDRLTTAYKESHASGEQGSILSTAGGLLISGKKALRRKFTELDEATAQRSLRLQKSTEEATAAQKQINREVPDEKRQNAISVFREAGGDVPTLQAWVAAAKGKTFKQAARDAQTLSAKELAISQKAGTAFDVLEKRGNRYDVLGSHRDNYVPHVWDVDNKLSGFGTSRLKDKFKFSKARTFDTFFDGDQAGFTPKTLAIGKLLPAYLHEMNRVIADRQFVQDVHGKSSTTGEPLVIPRGRVSETVNASGDKATLINPDATKLKKDAAGNTIDQSKYRQLEGHPALHDWLWEGKDNEGNPIFMRDDLSAHPELAKRINSMMGQSEVRRIYNEPSSGLAVIPKAIAKGLDTAQSVMKREMFGFLAPFHQVQEGTHAIGHLVNPFYDIPEIDLRKNTAQQNAVKHGLMLLPEKGSSQSYIEGVGGRGSFPSQIARKFGGKAGKAVADAIDGYQDYLFHHYIPGLKFKTYEHILDRNMARFKDELASGKVTDADVKVISAEQSNAAYGHLNYALLDRSPTTQHGWQIVLLAPDFLEARGKFVGQALKSLVGEKAGHEQLRAIATLAAFQAAAAFTITTLSGGSYDPKKPFEVRLGNRTYTLRSVPEDLFRLLFSGSQTRREFVSARVNPMAQKIDQLRTGLNYRGEKTGALDTVGEMLANYIPITARWIPGVRQLTETGRNNPVSPLEQLAGSLGVKVSRYSSITKVHEIANKWMEKQKLPKQEGIYPTSKYQQLRYDLEDGDMQRAANEYQKLLKTEKAEKIAKGFSDSIWHPFTGSKKTDEDFSAQLKGDDKLMYERAMELKHSIMEKFNTIPNIEAQGNTEQSSTTPLAPRSSRSLSYRRRGR